VPKTSAQAPVAPMKASAAAKPNFCMFFSCLFAAPKNKSPPIQPPSHHCSGNQQHFARFSLLFFCFRPV
jgi:hypothetical protein